MQPARLFAQTIRITAMTLLVLLTMALPSPSRAEDMQFMTAGCNDCGPGFGYSGYSAHSWGPGGTLYWDDGCQSLGNCNYEPILPLRARCRIDVNDYYTAPAWYFTAEAAPLFRDAAEDIRLTPPGALFSATTSTNNLNLEYAAGMRFTIGRALAPRYRMEFSYMGSFAWNDVSRFVGATDLISTRTIMVDNPLDPGNLINVAETTTITAAEDLLLDFESTFHNAEFNLRHRLLLPPSRYEASLLYGVRYMQVNESLGFNSDYTTNINTAVSDPVNSSVDVAGPASIDMMSAATNNDLIGFQIGLLGQFLAREDDSLWVDAEVKGAIAHNTAARMSVVNGVIGAHEQDATAFIGDVAVMANYRVLRWLTLRAGYQATFVTGLAMADRNIVTNAALLAPADVDHSGELILHGLVGGLSGAW